MKRIVEKILNAENKNSIWFAGMGAGNIKVGDNGQIEAVGRKDLANATVQNPIFFTTNAEYAYGYAKGYAEDGSDGYIGIVKVDDMKSINVLDLTDSRELASIFPACADSANFYEIFRKAEPYFGFNAGKVQQGTQRVQPAPFIIARMLITYRNQTKLGMSFNDMYKAFEDVLTPVKSSGKTGKKESRSMITHQYKEIEQHYLSLDELIFSESLRDVDFSKPFSYDEYTQLYNEYVMAVFKHSIRLNSTGNYVKDASGKYELTYYKDLFPDDTDGNNADRPTSRNRMHGLSKDDGILTQKIIHKVLPKDLSEEDVRHVNYYLQMSEELHKWYKVAAESENLSLAQKFEQICRIVNNDDSNKNSKRQNFQFVNGMASKYIDNLQYMFFYLVKSKSEALQGCYAPEVLAVTRTPKKLESKDQTIFLWNTDNIKFIDILNYRKFDRVMQNIDNANAAGDTESPFYSVGITYDDERLQAIYNAAKNATPDTNADSAVAKSRAPVWNEITKENYKKKYDKFKAYVETLLKSGSEAGEELAELNKQFMNHGIGRHASITPYAKKYHAMCQEYLRKILKKRKNITHDSEYSYLKQAHDIFYDDTGKEISWKDWYNKKWRAITDGPFKKINILLWAKKNPDKSKDIGGVSTRLTIEQLQHGKKLVLALRGCLEFENIRREFQNMVGKNSTRSQLRAKFDQLRSKKDEIYGYINTDEQEMPEIVKISEDFTAVEREFGEYKVLSKLDKYKIAFDLITKDEQMDMFVRFNLLGQILSNLKQMKADNEKSTLNAEDKARKKQDIVDFYGKVFQEWTGIKKQTDLSGYVIKNYKTYKADTGEAYPNKDSVQAIFKQLMSKTGGEFGGVGKHDFIVLWLDDRRDPNKYFKHTGKAAETETFARNKEFYDRLFAERDNIRFIWAKSLQEFSNYIIRNGLPDMLSFDYDLIKGQPKGSECAKWVVQYCADNNLPLPKYYIHSANRGGTEKIKEILSSYGNKKLAEALSGKDSAKLRRAMKKGVVEFSYRKKSTGKVRKAKGTLKKSELPKFADERQAKHNVRNFVYWDTEKNQFRCFNRENFIGFGGGNADAETGDGKETGDKSNTLKRDMKNKQMKESDYIEYLAHMLDEAMNSKLDEELDVSLNQDQIENMLYDFCSRTGDITCESFETGEQSMHLVNPSQFELCKKYDYFAWFLIDRNFTSNDEVIDHFIKKWNLYKMSSIFKISEDDIICENNFAPGTKTIISPILILPIRVQNSINESDPKLRWKDGIPDAALKSIEKQRQEFDRNRHARVTKTVNGKKVTTIGKWIQQIEDPDVDVWYFEDGSLQCVEFKKDGIKYWFYDKDAYLNSIEKDELEAKFSTDGKELQCIITQDGDKFWKDELRWMIPLELKKAWTDFENLADRAGDIYREYEYPENVVGATKQQLLENRKLNEDFQIPFGNITSKDNFTKEEAVKLGLDLKEFKCKKLKGNGTNAKEHIYKSCIMNYAGRIIVCMKTGNIYMPYYVSTGDGGKKDVQTGKWYPFFGICMTGKGWLNKLHGPQINNYYGSEKMKDACKKLDSIIDCSKIERDQHDGREYIKNFKYKILKTGTSDVSDPEMKNIAIQINSDLPVEPVDSSDKRLVDNIKKVVNAIEIGSSGISDLPVKNQTATPSIKVKIPLSSFKNKQTYGRYSIQFTKNFPDQVRFMDEKQFSVVVAGQTTFIPNEDSKNALYVNGKPADSAFIAKPGQVISVGSRKNTGKTACEFILTECGVFGESDMKKAYLDSVTKPKFDGDVRNGIKLYDENGKLLDFGFMYYDPKRSKSMATGWTGLTKNGSISLLCNYDSGYDGSDLSIPQLARFLREYGYELIDER